MTECAVGRDSACWHSPQWNPISIPSNLHSESVYRPTVWSWANVCCPSFPGSEQDVRRTSSQWLSRSPRLNGCYLQLGTANSQLRLLNAWTLGEKSLEVPWKVPLMPRPDWADQRITNPSILVNIAMQILTAKGRGETVLRAGDDEKTGPRCLDRP